jgi:signal transduction histidine kinase
MADFREKLTAMVAHEFKSPLNAIKLYRDIVARYSQTADEPRTRDALTRIDTQITHLIDLINDLLGLNQYSMGKLEPEYITFDLTDLCGAVTDHWQSIMSEKYTIIYQRPGKPITIAGDLKLLKRVLDNLLSNAVKYSAKRGNIILSVMQTDSDAVIRVKDEGIGIPNAARSRVFEMFERAENALHLSGTGVGLAFCRMVVDLHGGRIGFESEVDHGTTFVVQLPLKQPKQ